MGIFYILDDQDNPVESDMLTVESWLNSPQHSKRRQIDLTELVDPLTREKVMISTVFLAVNHNHRNDGPPILFETIVFGGPLDMTQRRYVTKRQALEGHYEIVMKVMVALDGDVETPETAPSPPPPTLPTSTSPPPPPKVDADESWDNVMNIQL